MSDFVKTFTYFYQIPYPKNYKIWTKLDNFFVKYNFHPYLTFFLHQTLSSTRMHIFRQLPFLQVDTKLLTWFFMLSDKCTKSNRSALQGKEKKSLDRHNQNFVGKILQHIFIHIKTIFITHYCFWDSTTKSKSGNFHETEISLQKILEVPLFLLSFLVSFHFDDFFV